MEDRETEEYIDMERRRYVSDEYKPTKQDARDYELIWDDGDYEEEKSPEFWDHIRWLYG